MQIHKFVVSSKLSGKPVDLALVALDLGLSRRQIRAVLDAGGVFLSGKKVRRASMVVFKGNELEIRYSQKALAQKKRVMLKEDQIIYCDDFLLAVNKPPLVASQPTQSQKSVHLVKVLKDSFPKLSENKLLLCHRLDKETTGLLLMAKDQSSCQNVMDQFREKTIEKSYLAICRGIPKVEKWEVQCFLSGMEPKTGAVKVVSKGGKSSFTSFSLLAKNEHLGLSLVKCQPRTGRSHQIRVHLEKSGIPILGDKKYGPDSGGHEHKKIAEVAAVHHMLHAFQLNLKHPQDGRAICLKSFPGEHFQAVLELARLSAACLKSTSD